MPSLCRGPGAAPLVFCPDRPSGIDQVAALKQRSGAGGGGGGRRQPQASRLDRGGLSRPARLVFHEEAGHGRAPRSERCQERVQHGHGPITVLAAAPTPRHDRADES